MSPFVCRQAAKTLKVINNKINGKRGTSKSEILSWSMNKGNYFSNFCCYHVKVRQEDLTWFYIKKLNKSCFTTYLRHRQTQRLMDSNSLRRRKWCFVEFSLTLTYARQTFHYYVIKQVKNRGYTYNSHLWMKPAYYCACAYFSPA